MKRSTLVLFALFFPMLLSAQQGEPCGNSVILTLVSINFGPGCDFNDYGGIDAAITIGDLNGNVFINNEIEDLGQVQGPGDNIPFDLSSNPDCCNNGYSQQLTVFPIDDNGLDFFVEVYDNDGGCCDGYQSYSDDNYGSGIVAIDISDGITGTIDVGSCISFNYELTITPVFGFGKLEVFDTVCADENLFYNNVLYNIDNPSGVDTLKGASANGCDSIIEVNLDFYEGDLPEIQGDLFLCTDGEGVLGVDDEYETYEWSTGETSPTIDINMPGLYNVEVTNANGCLLQDIVIVEYFPDVPPTIVGDDVLCEGEESTLSIQGEFASYSWSDGSVEPNLTVTESGEYFVTVENVDGCISENSFLVNVITVEEPMILGDSLICEGNMKTLTVDGEYDRYEWSTGATTQSIQITSGGEYTVNVFNGIGCNSRTSKSIKEISKPNYKLPENGFIISGMSITFDIDIKLTDGILVNWFDEDNELICSGCSSIEVSPNLSTSYVVEINFDDCQVREIIDLNVKSNTNVFIPNVFTPDSQDGNNTLFLEGPDVLSLDEMSVYDRWGTLLYQNFGNDAAWDGTKGGRKLLSGVYVYLIKVTYNDGTQKTLAGDITLLR